MKCCTICAMVAKTWKRGDIECGEVNTESAQYVAQYTTKKMTDKDDMRLGDRHPEFARMSLKPGIGAAFMPYVADSINSMAIDLVALEGDVPSSLRHGKRIMPMGRYLRRKLREEVGLAPEAPLSTIIKAQAELQPMRDSAFENSRSFKEEVMKEFDGKVAQIEHRANLWKQRRKL